MSSSIAISVKSLGKLYSIGGAKSNSLRQTINQLFQGKKNEQNDFWAISDLNFDIHHGDVVGIIGRNGAGKSTLLKLLSRITQPTTGRIDIHGRVASLLEVGTGFHPELTGLENIYLNGTILGMTRSEINRKKSEIIEFSGIRNFINTPVKHYSSGMYVRLAFSVAAHLEPEILIVDEVLAVGDIEFQQKCLGKMGEISGQGRTVLFVSHNLAAVQNLCGKGLVLNKGQSKGITNINEAVADYIEDIEKLKGISLADREDRDGSQAVVLTNVEFFDHNNKAIDLLISGEKARVRFHFVNSNNIPISNFKFDLGINSNQDARISWISTSVFGDDNRIKGSNEFYIDLVLPKLALTAGKYSVTTYLSVNHDLSDWVRNAFFFDIDGGDFYGTGKIAPQDQGFFQNEYEFEY
jgi:lipopolysaccharide transport system ATP-binding protein